MYVSLQNLQDIDDEFKQNHLTIITRFYSVFEGIHTFVMDLNRFLEELEEGMYIHQTLETVFADVEGKQLLVQIISTCVMFKPHMYTFSAKRCICMD